MGKFEICFIIAMSVLITLCLVSFIVTAAVGKRGSKIIFCVISCLALVLTIGVTLVWMRVVSLDITNELYVLKSKLYNQLLTGALGVVSACEFSGMLVMLVKKEHISVITHKEELSEIEIPQTENVRKVGERKHGNYKIVDKEE